jgi:hypothetical protein
MFGLFKKKKKELSLVDLEGNPLNVGDKVESLRYDLGECVLEAPEAGPGIDYVSIASGQRVSWVRMIDAATERQKVKLSE